MKLPRNFCWRLGVLFAVSAFLLIPARVLAINPEAAKIIQARALDFERRGEWDKACVLYHSLLPYQSAYPDVRAKYLHALRRYFQTRRHQDISYRREVLALDYAQSLRLYQFILNYLADHALDRYPDQPERFFRRGLDELDSALNNPVFQRAYLSETDAADIEAFRINLREQWGERSIYSLQQAANEVREVAMSALRKLRLRPTLVVMEFACGACYAVDDYTMYLTPAELRTLYESLKGESVGVGLKLGVRGDQLVITEILPDGPADLVEDPPLERFDRISSIDGKPAHHLPPEVAMEMLHGEPGTEVEIGVQSTALDGGERLVKLRRRAVFAPSVHFEMKTSEIGYIGISAFQESTIEELDAALVALGKLNMQALVLDLRGNSGGLVEAAIQTARRFLPSGVIVSTKGVKSPITIYHSRNPLALTIPLVVLIDGQTASAAEILAGALKDHGRARLVGQTTFGKGCIQELIRLAPRAGEDFPGGLRITVARFLSPSGLPYSGNGVVPHIPVEQPSMPGSLDPKDQQLAEALREAQLLLDPELM